MAKTRLNMEVSDDLVKLLDSLADKEDVSRTEIVRRAISVMKTFNDQIKHGRTHMVFTAEPKPSDVELVGVLTPPSEVESLAIA